MPPRLSRSSLPSARPQNAARSSSTRGKDTRKLKQRSLNAFSIAGHSAPERIRVRQHRLGAAEDSGENVPRKRQRGTDDDEDGDGDGVGAARVQRRKLKKGRFDELDVSEGSDSEGNEWKMGVVDEGEDSDVDSDEAFGESDEERFEGFTFRGSSRGVRKVKAKKARNAVRTDADIDLREEVEDEEGEGSDDSLGADAVDLATMLDDASGESEGEETKDATNTKSSQVSAEQRKLPSENGAEEDIFEGLEVGNSSFADALSEEEAESELSASSQSGFSSSDDEADERDPSKLEQLRTVAATLSHPSPSADPINADIDDRPTADSLLAALQTMPGLDAGLTRSIKQLARSIRPSKTGGPTDLVTVPLPKRQQDRLDRAAAYDKAKETLGRWVDTVKHNRRAEHLSFPLADPHAHDAEGASRLLATGADAPRGQLEGAIRDILAESGLTPAGGQSQEARLAAAEELEVTAAKVPVEEVMARRAELRRQRDLLFREEVRAKRVKKIKSKAYRRVHRREGERAAQKERDMLRAAGIEESDEERERKDRQRAEERMGARHRESRWAKSVKGTGRGAWDEEARGGVQEMARRREQLTRRMEGETERSGGEEESENEELGSGSEDEDEGGFKLRVSEKLDELAVDHGEEPTSKLGAMKFMQRANALQKQRNEQDIRQMQRDLNGQASEEEEEPEGNVGRRIFGPRTDLASTKLLNPNRNELEEHDSSASEDAGLQTESADKEDDVEPPRPALEKTAGSTQSGRKTLSNGKAVVRDNQPHRQTDVRSAQRGAPARSTKAPNSNGWTTIPYRQGDDSAVPQATSRSNDDEIKDNVVSTADADVEVEPNPLIPSNSELIQAAFGGDEVETAFAAEKAAAITSEDDKVTDHTLPGWGSWGGAGISKRELARAATRNKGRFVTVEPGVRPERRADAKLGAKVIVSERQVRKNAKYLASTLPHPFESRAQYERSLRLPVGPEWTTKETFQAATKPRVLVKQGIIRPMQRPVL